MTTFQPAELCFVQFSLNGPDVEKFLQGQVTLDVPKLPLNEQRATAICDLKGRVMFELWLTRRSAEHCEIVIPASVEDALRAHIRKYGAFSKMTTTESLPLFPHVIHGMACLSPEDINDGQAWAAAMIAAGRTWISAVTQGMFQPQELRLHQRHGVDYDKGCYLGQEVIARLWFRASPKQWLHRIAGSGALPEAGSFVRDHVQVVNAVQRGEGWEALVVARPDALEGFKLLELPPELSGSPERPR